METFPFLYLFAFIGMLWVVLQVFKGIFGNKEESEELKNIGKTITDFAKEVKK